jgi:hypothetical protein
LVRKRGQLSHQLRESHKIDALLPRNAAAGEFVAPCLGTPSLSDSVELRMARHTKSQLAGE